MRVAMKFRPKARERFLKFLLDSFGDPRYRRFLDIPRCEHECLEAFTNSLNTGEPLEWQVRTALRSGKTRIHVLAQFRAVESDLVITNKDEPC